MHSKSGHFFNRVFPRLYKALFVIIAAMFVFQIAVVVWAVVDTAANKDPSEIVKPVPSTTQGET